MMRNRLRFWSVFVGALLLNGMSAVAQFSRREEQGYSAEQLSPLVDLFKGISNVLYETASLQSPGRYWDSSSGHYRGGMLRCLRFPEIVRAGYRSFSLVTLEAYHQGPSLQYGTPESILQETAAAAGRDNGRILKTYHFDDSGWLRAIVYKAIHPAYENFEEASDSVFYTFRPDGSADLMWKHTYYSTGRGGGSGRSGCPPPKPFMAIRKSEIYEASFNAWELLTGYSSRSEEIWDTCRGGGEVYTGRRITYDSIGRLLTVVDTSSGYGAPVAERVYSYEDVPYDRFEAAVQGAYQYAPLREATIRNWLQKQGALRAIAVRASNRSYLYYDYRIRGNRFRPDSPRVETDTALYVVKPSMELVLLRPGGLRQALAIYDQGVDSATRGIIRRVQRLPIPPDPDAGPVTVCDPLALGSFASSAVIRSSIDSGTLLRIIAADGGSSSGYPGAASKLQFSALPPSLPPGQLRAMALQDRNGLIRYLWTGSDTYQFTYYP